MKCLYFLTPSLESSKRVSDDIQAAGIQDWYIHVISKDESGLNEKHLNSSNYFETLDLVRGTTVGGIVGFLMSLVLVYIAIQTEPFGFPLSNTVYFILIAFLTLFGIWEGGLYGVDSRNKKIQPFQKEIDNGNHLVLVYAAKDDEKRVRDMMKEKHHEAKLVAVDRHFVNPFSKLKLV